MVAVVAAQRLGASTSGDGDEVTVQLALRQAQGGQGCQVHAAVR